jgi:hypothetical protein
MDLPVQAYLLMGFFGAVLIAVSVGYAILKLRR